MNSKDSSTEDITHAEPSDDASASRSGIKRKGIMKFFQAETVSKKQCLFGIDHSQPTNSLSNIPASQPSANTVTSIHQIPVQTETKEETVLESAEEEELDDTTPTIGDATAIYTVLCIRCGDTNQSSTALQRICNLCKFLSQMVFSCRKHAAKRKGRAVECDITYSDLISIWRSQGGYCYYSGVKMTWKTYSDWQVSPERLDNTLGYVEGNVVLVAIEFNVGLPGWSSAKIAHLLENVTPSSSQVEEHNERVQLLIQASVNKPPRGKRRVHYETIDGIPSFTCNDCDRILPISKMDNSICAQCSSKIRNARPKKPKGQLITAVRTIVDDKQYITCNGCQTMVPMDEMPEIGTTAKPQKGTRCKPCLAQYARRRCEGLVGRMQLLVNGAKARCIRPSRVGRGLVCTLTTQDLITMFKNQGGRCAYSGLPLVIAVGSEVDWRVSLERVDSNKSYTSDNCLLICYEFNSIDNSARSDKPSASGRWNREKFLFALDHIRRKLSLTNAPSHATASAASPNSQETHNHTNG